MTTKQKLPRFEEQGSDWESNGLFAAKDWRYEALVDYLKLSPSYKLACDWARGQKGPAPDRAPRDWNKVLKVYDDFGDVFRIRESAWWNIRGRELFGIRASQVRTFALGSSNAYKLVDDQLLKKAEITWTQMAKPDSLIIAIPTNQTKQVALKQIRAIIRDCEFKTAKPLKAKYELVRSKLRESTIKLGIFALKMYRRGAPLWVIANQLDLAPAYQIELDERGIPDHSDLNIADKKIRLQIMASKLIAKAELIAENAARGIYPSDAPCKYALKLGSATRKAGRPAKPK